MRTREVGSHSDILTCAEVENARAAARVAVEILDANILRDGKSAERGGQLTHSINERVILISSSKLRFH